jgi:hypothetical protein
MIGWRWWSRASGLVSARLDSLSPDEKFEIHTERTFLDELDGVISDGAIDVWASEHDGTVLIVDSKTDTRHLDHNEPFALQHAIYALTALRTGATVSKRHG